MATNRDKQKNAETTELSVWMDTLIERKRKAKKESTADLYRAASNWFRKFTHSPGYPSGR